MKVQIGQIYMDEVTKQKSPYPNKTKKYLLPCLKEYGETFTNKLNNVFKIAIGIGDFITDTCGFKHEKHLFILLDSTIATKYFTSFLDWIRTQSMYEDDYVFGDIQKSNSHMVVLKFPEKFYGAFETFKLGAYSKMFDEETINKFFHNHPRVAKVLIKDHEYRFYFVSKVNKMYQAQVKAEEWDGELDFPPTETKEKFNSHLKKSNND